MLRSLLFFALSAVMLGAYAQPLNCKTQAAKLSSESGQAVRCYCGAELDNLSLTLPKGLKLAGACALKDAKGAAIDLERQKLSLDADVAKAYPSGIIYLSGTMALDGVVTVNPSDRGEMWFESTPLTSSSQFVSKYMASNIKLGSEEDYREFHAPKQQLLTPECFNAQASISASDLEVTLAAGGKGGTVARRVDAKKVARFKKCDPNSRRLVEP